VIVSVDTCFFKRNLVDNHFTVSGLGVGYSGDDHFLVEIDGSIGVQSLLNVERISDLGLDVGVKNLHGLLNYQ